MSRSTPCQHPPNRPPMPPLKNFGDIFREDRIQEPTDEMGFLDVFGDKNGKTVNKEVSQEPYRAMPGKGAIEAQPKRAAPPARGSDYIMQMIHGRTTAEQDHGWRSLQYEILLAQFDAAGGCTATTPPGDRQRRDPIDEGCPLPRPEPQKQSRAKRAYEKVLARARTGARDKVPQPVVTPQASDVARRG